MTISTSCCSPNFMATSDFPVAVAPAQYYHHNYHK
jgi:hypothetical protein